MYYLKPIKVEEDWPAKLVSANANPPFLYLHVHLHCKNVQNINAINIQHQDYHITSHHITLKKVSKYAFHWHRSVYCVFKNHFLESKGDYVFFLIIFGLYWHDMISMWVALPHPVWSSAALAHLLQGLPGCVFRALLLPSYQPGAVWLFSSNFWHQQDIFTHRNATHWISCLSWMILCKRYRWLCGKIPAFKIDQLVWD